MAKFMQWTSMQTNSVSQNENQANLKQNGFVTDNLLTSKSLAEFFEIISKAKTSAGSALNTFMLPNCCFIHVLAIVKMYRMYCLFSKTDNTYHQCFGFSDDANRGNDIMRSYLRIFEAYYHQIVGDTPINKFEGVTDLEIGLTLQKEFGDVFDINVSEAKGNHYSTEDTLWLIVTSTHVDVIDGNSKFFFNQFIKETPYVHIGIKLRQSVADTLNK
jgi:hypothetical protein